MTICDTDPRNGAAGNWLIRDIRLTDAGCGLDEDGIDLLVLQGKVKRTAKRIVPSPAESEEGISVIDGRKLWLWPGLIDGHVHFREPGFEHKETFLSGSRAAARGGYTTVICEPNTEPPLAFCAAVKLASAAAGKAVDSRIFLKAAMTYGREGRRTADYESLALLPAVAALSDDGDPVSSAALMEEICRRAGRTRLPLSPHCEDSPRALSDYETGTDPGFKPGEPYSNETLYVERDISLASRHGCRIHLSHLSTATSVNAVCRFKADPGCGAAVSCEVTPHHLLLSSDNYPADTVPAVNPPLRSGRDVKAMQEALIDGRIDAVASDHAPHSQREKALGACGLIGLETTLGLLMTGFVKPGSITPLQACRLLSSGPAEIFGLAGGTVAEGAPADLAFIDPGRQWTVDPDEFESLSRNTPFAGWRLTGKAIGTMLAGKLTYADDALRNRISKKTG